MFGSKRDKDSAKEKALKRGVALTAMIAGLATASGGVPAFAQEAEEPEAQTQEEDADIVVTGSRIRRNEFTSSSPVQIITSEQSSLEGLIDTSEILQGSTVASGSLQINNQFTGFVVEGGPGVNTISLRGLGANRTLVLLNGRRLSPAGTRGQVGAVDTNVIPASMWERVEILKDGASSIYGSDAVAGVVNIITYQDYDGLQIEATGNVSEHGGGENFTVNGMWGHVGDRAQVLIGGEYYKRESLNWGDRDYLSCAQDLVTDGEGGPPLDIIDPNTGESKCFNLLQGVIDRGGAFPTGGRYVPDTSAVAGGGPFGLDLAGYRRVGLSWVQVANRLYGTSTALNATQVSALLTPAQISAVEAAWRSSQAAVPTASPLYGSRNAISPAERYSIFATGTLDISGNAELYGEFMYNHRESSTASLRQLFPTLASGHAGNPAPFGASTALPVIQLPSITAQEVDFVRLVAGIRGDFGGDGFLSGWAYDLYVQSSYSDGTYGNNFFYNDRVVATSAFPEACRQSAIISGATCMPVDYVSAVSNGFTQAEAAFLFGYEEGNTVYNMTTVSGIITGDVMRLPAGAVGLALGAELRDDSIDDVPGFNARTGNLWGQTSAGRTQGSDSTRELFGEIEVPLIANAPMFENLSFNGSYRWTDYDSFGDDSTYKMGVNWQLTPEYRLRGSFGTSYRAPALYELFLANQTAFQGQVAIDPCTNWNTSSNPLIVQNCGPGGHNLPANYTGAIYSSATIITGGGAGILEAETSEATTFGAVWTPNWIDLSIAVDYFKIEVEDEVAQFGAANILAACYTDPLFPNSPFCQLFQRDLTPGSPTYGRINTVNNSYINLDRQVTEGIDVTIRYEHEFPFGTFRLDARGTWTFEDTILLFEGTQFERLSDFNGMLTEPDFTGELDFRFDRNDWTYFWNVDLVSKSSDTEWFLGDTFRWRASPYFAYFRQYADWYASHNASVRYQSDTWTFQAGVRNLFDEEPPTISTSGTAFSARLGNSLINSQYDIIGRQYWASIARRW